MILYIFDELDKFLDQDEPIKVKILRDSELIIRRRNEQDRDALSNKHNSVMFDKLDVFYKSIKLSASNKFQLRNRNKQERNELIYEREFVRGLCEPRVKDDETFDVDVRLEALKSVQKKVKSSNERFELEEQIFHKASPILIIFLGIYGSILFFYLTIPHFTNIVVDKINTNFATKLTTNFIIIQLTILGLNLILFCHNFLSESLSKKQFIKNKRRLELIEQAIELAENYKSKVS